MSFMKQLEEYKEFSNGRTSGSNEYNSERPKSPDRSRSHSSGRSDGRREKKRHRDRSRRRSRSRSRSSSSDRHHSRRRRSNSSDGSSDEMAMERSISDKPTAIILARGITEFMNESILRDAIISSGYYPRDIVVARKRRSGHVRGFGFIEFYNAEDARKWLESHQGTFYMGEERLSLLFCIPSASPFFESSNESRSGDWNCARCGNSNWRDRESCFRCCTRREDAGSDRRLRGNAEKPNFDRVGRHPCNTILIRGLDSSTVSERSIKSALYEQQRIASTSIRSCFIMRNPPITETTRSSSSCYAFIELSSTHEATQLVDRLQAKALEIDGKQALVSFARYPFTTVMANIHQWLASASQTQQDQADAASYAPTQSDVTNAAAAVAQAAMMARQQAEAERAKRRAKRRERAERKRERGEHHRHRSGSASSSSCSAVSSDEEDSRSSASPLSVQSSMAAAAAAASFSVSQQYGLGTVPNVVNAGGSFQFDSSTGYYCDAVAGSYYDPKTRYFYSQKLAQWLMWDVTNCQYVPVPSQPVADDPSTFYNQADGAANSNLAESEEIRREREKKEKAKEARRVQKEMEKWAANVNDHGSNSGTSVANRRQQQVTSTPASNENTGGMVTSQLSTADAAFAFMQTSSSSNMDQQSLVDASVTHLLSLLDWETFICRLCSRKLTTEEQLRKHCVQSDLHKSNTDRWCKEQGLTGNIPALVAAAVGRVLNKATETTVSTTAVPPNNDKQKHVDDSYVYRDRAKERRQKSYTGSSAREPSSSSSAAYSGSSHSKDASSGVSLEQPVGGVGQKLIEKMGWEMGKGLGRHSQGRVDPIAAEMRQSRVGLGSSGSLSSAKPGEALDYREAAKRTLFSRFHELR